MKCGNCGVKAMAGGIAMLNAEKDQWRCPACKAWNVIKEETTVEQSELNDLLSLHLDAARNALILAYNTAKNAKLEDTRTSIAWALADVSAELQCRKLMLQG